MSAPANYDAVSTDIDEAAELIESAGIDDAVGNDDAAVQDQRREAIRVVKGNPSDEEIAALVAVLTAAAAGASGPAGDSRPPELWGTPASMHRTYAPFSPYSFASSNRY